MIAYDNGLECGGGFPTHIFTCDPPAYLIQTYTKPRSHHGESVYHRQLPFRHLYSRHRLAEYESRSCSAAVIHDASIHGRLYIMAFNVYI